MKELFHIDADRKVVTELNKMAPKLFDKAPPSKLKEQCQREIDDCVDDLEKRGMLKP